MRALVVDDSAAIRRAFQKLLTSLEWQVLCAENSVQALAVLNQQPDVKLVLTDWHMPGGSGLDLITQVRLNQTQQHIKIILVSSDRDPHTIKTALLAGADDYLAKPFSKEQLAQCISELVDDERTEV